MVDIFQVETEQHKKHVEVLFSEYLTWVKGKFNQWFGVDFEVEPQVQEDLKELHKFDPPQGRLLLVEHNDQIIGIGGLCELGERIGEIKRMFVREGFQGKGIGRTVLDSLMEQAQIIGYETLRLDVGPYATSAQKLYRTIGFSSISVYPGCEIPPEFHSQWSFMEFSLS